MPKQVYISLQKQICCFNHALSGYHGCRQVEETVVMYCIFLLIV